MATGFSPTGQPIQGRKYTLTQGDLTIPLTVVGKLYGRGGNSDLVGIICEEADGGRGTIPWPIEASDGAEPISFVAGWPDAL
jgi:hypothetical protein